MELKDIYLSFKKAKKDFESEKASEVQEENARSVISRRDLINERHSQARESFVYIMKNSLMEKALFVTQIRRACS